MRSAWALLAFLLLAPAAQGQPDLADLGGQELNARILHVVEYHPYPDPQTDDWGFPAANETDRGYMEATYGAYWYPTTAIDGTVRIEGATAFQETYGSYLEAIERRRLDDAPVRLFVHATLGDGVDVTIKAQAKSGERPAAVEVRAVLVEDEVAYDGGNGVDVHRFVARAVLHEADAAFNATGVLEVRAQGALAAAWDRERLAVVVSLHHRGAPEAGLERGEVLQATTFRFGQSGPTIQERRGVLLEMLTATWCDACVFGDAAVDQLANELGIPSSKALQSGANYVRPFNVVPFDLSTGSWETLLLALALGAFAGAFILDLRSRPDARRERLVRRAFHAGTLLVTLALALLTLYFLIGRISLEYVFTYTRRDYPWHYRLAGLWAGQQGTLLIWTAATAAFGALFLRKGERAIQSGASSEAARPFLLATRRILLAILALLTLSLLIARTFAPASDYLLLFRPDGNGLQPVLLTPFMIIHPPIQFLSYALAGVVFAAGLAHVATGSLHWAPLVRPWVRLNWALATFGLGLGGLWAYYVLNFGGFWAWDPVETANLIAWFPLTLLLHALLHYKEGQHRTSAPLFALLTLPTVLFSTVATRTGLWVSVHAFTDPSKNFAQDPLVRLQNILETSALLRYLTALLVLSLAAAFLAVALARVRDWQPSRRRTARIAIASAFSLAALLLILDIVAGLGWLFQAADAATLGRSAPLGLVLLAFAAVALVLLTGRDPPEAPTDRSLARWMSPTRLLTVGIALLGLSFLVIFLLDVASVNGYDRAVYDDRAPYVALPIFLVLAAQFLRARLAPKATLAIVLATAAIALTLSAALPHSRHILLVLPALLLAAGASLWRLLDLTASGGQAARRDRALGTLLIAGALLALLHWGNPPSRIFGFAVAWRWALPACAIAAGVLATGALQRSRPQPGAARAAALGLILLDGPWHLCALIGLAVLALARGRAAAPFADAWRSRRAGMRKASVYLLHIGLAVGLVGYTLATYGSVATDPFDAGPAAAPVRGYTFEPLEARFVGHDAEQGLPLEVHAIVRVAKDGGAVGDFALVYWLVRDGTPGHYDARVTVVRTTTEDIYLFPERVALRGQELTDHVNDARPIDPTLEGVGLTAKVLPGVGLVWAGLWVLVGAMAARLALGGFAVGEGAPRTIAAARRDEKPFIEPVPGADE